ncbi:MAG: PPOX class F420-dependent oxidoreductase [Actinobacteria bacterium]|nr:PPOX class F420-dependent oxidoreductase [Actinomycetota bacterium]
MTMQSGQTMIPDSHKDILESTALAHIATLGPSGEPQSNPVWFDWDGEHVKFSQTKTRQKYHNVKRDPRIALSIVDPEDPYRYLEIRGIAERIDEDPDLDFINSMSKKYRGVYPYQNHRPGDERVVVFVRPQHTTKKDG